MLSHPPLTGPRFLPRPPCLSQVLRSSACARLACATLLFSESTVPARRPQRHKRTVGGDISTWVHLLGSDQGERVGPGGSEIWDGAKVISKEARKGGENGPGLGDKDPDGEVGRGRSPVSRDWDARFSFFKRRLPCAFSTLCPRGVLSSRPAYPEALPAPSDRARTLNLGSRGPTRLSPQM